MEFCFRLINKCFFAFLLTVSGAGFLLGDDYTNQYKQFGFSHQIIERSSAFRVKNFLSAIGGRNDLKVITDHNKPLKSITLLDGDGKKAAYQSKMAWIYHVYVGTCVVQGNCNEDWFLTGDEFDGVGEWEITDKTNDVTKALHGRNFKDINSFTMTCPGATCLQDTPELKNKWLDLYDRYVKLTSKVSAVELYWNNNGALVSQVAYWLYDFKVKNVPGTNYKNMKLIIEYKDGTKQQSYFTARPDRIVTNDFNTKLTKYKDCVLKDCLDLASYPIAGLKYNVDKTKNIGVAKTSPLNLAHNFIAVDAKGDIVQSYSGTFSAKIKSAVETVTKNGVTTKFNIPEVNAEAVFINGYGYIRTAADNSVTYPYATHTFVTIVDDSLSKLNDGKCIKNTFRNTKWHGYGWSVDSILPGGDIGCDTVLITKPRSLSSFDRTILNGGTATGYNIYKNYYLANNNYRSDGHKDMGDYWYTFAPAEIRISHNVRDYFDNMTYYDNLDKNDSVYGSIDINITAHNADSGKTIALTYSSDKFNRMDIRPIDDPKTGLAMNDLNISITIPSSVLNGDKALYQLQPLQNKRPVSAYGDKAINITIPRGLFQFGEALAKVAVNLGRDPRVPKDPKNMQGTDIVLDFKEVVKSGAKAMLPTNAKGQIINPLIADHIKQVVKSTGSGEATFYYARYYIPRHTAFNNATTGSVVDTHSVYCSTNCDNYPLVIDKTEPTLNIYPGNINELRGFYLNQQASAQGLEALYGFNGSVPALKQLKLDIEPKSIKSSIDPAARVIDLTYSDNEFPYTYDLIAVPKDKFGNNVLNYAGSETAHFFGYEPWQVTWLKDNKTAGASEWRGYGSEGKVSGVSKANKTKNARKRIQD